MEITRADDEIVIWPNPSTGTVTVENLPSHVTRAEISDLNGTIRKSKEIRSNGSALPLITGLAPGLYLISFYGDNYAVTKKIVIR